MSIRSPALVADTPLMFYARGREALVKMNRRRIKKA
jgi:hypothetical protein